MYVLCVVFVVNYGLCPVVISAMPATHHKASNNSPPTEPYSLGGISKAQLTALTVATLQLYLKHFKLSTQGKKAILVDRLHSHLLSLDDTTPPLSHSQDTPTLPPHLLTQLTAVLYQVNNTQGVSSSSTAIGKGQLTAGTVDDDRLSTASEPVHITNFNSIQVAPTTSTTTQVNPAPSTTPAIPTPWCVEHIMQPSLPPVLPRILEKISRGEYIDFTTIQPKAVFETPEPHSQSLTHRLNPEDDNYAIQPSTSNSKIHSFSAWMEAWNVYLAVRVDLQPVLHTISNCIPLDYHLCQF